MTHRMAYESQRRRAAVVWLYLHTAGGARTADEGRARALILRAPTRAPGLNDAAIFWSPDAPDDPLWFAVTCDPGPSTLAAPANPKGAAVLAPGAYPGMWQAGRHPRSKPAAQQRPALVQVGPCTVDRVAPGVIVGDDTILFPSNPDTGVFGINFHSMGTPDWSAGCVGPHTQAEVDAVLALVGARLVDVVVAPASAWNLNDLLPH